MNKLILLLLFVFLFSSCRTHKDVLYFQNLSQVIQQTDEVYDDPKIQTGDALIITVTTFNTVLAQPFNITPPAGSGSSGGATSELSPIAYVVNSDGEIEMPVLGTMEIAGRTRKELAEYLRKELSFYVEDPIVNIKFLNFRVSMLGEFNRPGVVQSTSEKLSIMEAISYAGDMSLYGIRDSVMIIRTIDGVREHTYLNLLDANSINSEYFYLRQNDIVYAMPTKSRSMEFNSRPIRDGLTILGFVLTIYALFK